MSSIRDKIRHAFAVEPSGSIEPTSKSQREVVDRVCREIARRHLSTPGLVFISMFKPVHYVGSQLLGRVIGWPIIKAIARDETEERYNELMDFLERRGSFDYICDRIEHFEAEFERIELDRRRREQPSKGAENQKNDAKAEPDASDPQQ